MHHTKGTEVLNTNKTEEVFNLDGLPWLLQQMIIEEVDLTTFPLISSCSLKTNELCSRRKSLLPIKMQFLHVYKRRTFVLRSVKIDSRLRNNQLVVSQKNSAKPQKLTRLAERGYRARCDDLVVMCNLTGKVCRRLIGQIKKHGTTFQFFDFPVYYSMDCSMDEFNTLIEVSKCESITSLPFISRDYFRLPAVQKVSSISIHENDLGDAEFLGLRATYLSMNTDCVSDTAVIQYIQECASGSRAYESFTFYLKFDRLKPILEALGAELVLSRESHPTSPLSHVPFDDLNHPSARRTYRVPSEAHEDGSIILSLIESGGVESYFRNTESMTISAMFQSNEQYYEVD